MCPRGNYAFMKFPFQLSSLALKTQKTYDARENFRTNFLKSSMRPRTDHSLLPSASFIHQATHSTFIASHWWRLPSCGLTRTKEGCEFHTGKKKQKLSLHHPTGQQVSSLEKKPCSRCTIKVINRFHLLPTNTNGPCSSSGRSR